MSLPSSVVLCWRFCALGHDHSLYCKPYIPTECPKKRIFFHYQLSSQLALEGHVPSNPFSQNGNSESAFFFGTPCISSWYTPALCEYDDSRSWHDLLEGHDDVDEEKMKMSMVMRLTSPIGILAKAYLPSLAIAALLLRRRRKKYCLPGLSWAFMFTIDWQFFRFYKNKISHGCPQAAEVVLNAKSRKLFWILPPCEESAAHRADSRRLFLGTIEERKLG